ncbi:hypothetical protein HYU95_04290 [Candidatus Daviesbacteria bacterium]|nr:hypothetical protein [Candidatus Daviesbacteria bacterium]
MIRQLPNPIFIFLAIAAVVVILLLLRRYHLRKKISRYNEGNLEDAQKKGYEILYQSIKKAQATLANAELEGIKLLAGSKLATNKLDSEYSTRLSESIKFSQDTLSQELNETKKAVALAEQQFINFLNELGTSAKNIQSNSQTLTNQRISELFERFETRLSDFLIKTEQTSTHSIELELRSTRQLIETYKTQQMALIDENIIAMMEQTLNLVLTKKLSIKDQLDLVYEALEKAKIEKFIV